VKPDVESVLLDFKSKGKVIGLTCIAPILAAVVFGNKDGGVKLTLGGTDDRFPYKGAIEVAKSKGNTLEEMEVHQVCIDMENKIVTTPAYMQDVKPYEVVDGVNNLVIEVEKLVNSSQ